MKLSSFLYDVLPFVFLGLAILFDWRRNLLLKRAALEANLPDFSANPFNYGEGTRRARESLVEGSLKKRVGLLDLSSVLAMIGFATLLFLSTKHK